MKTTYTLDKQQPGKFHGLDTLRALAILMVFVFHYERWFEHPAWIPEFVRFGWTGVDLFFVLSGFLIASQLFAQIKAEGTFSVREFYIKRFFRILPVYYFVLAAYFLFPMLGGTQLLPPLWKFLTFTQNFNADFANRRAFGVVWSLCVEEHFYLLLPVTLLLLLKTGTFSKGYLLLAGLFLAGFAIRLCCWHYLYLPQTNGVENRAIWVATLYYPTYCRLDGLLAGVSVAALYNYLPALFLRLSRHAGLWIAAGGAVLVAAYFVCANPLGFNRSIFGFPLVSIGFGCVVLGAVMPGSFLYKWKSAVSGLVARLSYALYLVHMAVVLVAQDVFSGWGVAKDGNLMLVLCLACCLLVALALHHGIERPFMRMRGRFLKKDRQPLAQFAHSA